MAMQAAVLTFDPEIAAIPEIGVNGAIFIAQLKYWLKRSKNIRDGEKWVYKTLNEWATEFRFWSEGTIRRVIDTLEGLEILISTDCYNANPFSRRKWYRLDQTKLKHLIAHESGQPSELINLIRSSRSECAPRADHSDQLFLESVDPETTSIDSEITSTTTPSTPIVEVPATTVVVDSDSPDKREILELPLDPRLELLYAEHRLDVQRADLRKWAAEFGLDTVIEKARWYVFGRAIGRIHSVGFLYDSLRFGWGNPYLSARYDESKYYTPNEREDRESAARERWGMNDDDPVADPEDEPAAASVPVEPPDPMQVWANDIWRTAYGELQFQMSRETFDTWLRASRFSGYDEDSNAILIKVQNQYAYEWLTHRLKKLIVRSVSQIAGREMDVQFEVPERKASD